MRGGFGGGYDAMGGGGGPGMMAGGSRQIYVSNVCMAFRNNAATILTELLASLYCWLARSQGSFPSSW
jgi:hypothetical protein